MSFADLLHRAGQLPGLSQTQKGILMALVIHSDVEGWSCPGLSTIQEYCSLKSSRPITPALRVLEEQGYILVERRNGALNWYRLHLAQWPERRRRVPGKRQPPNHDQGSGGGREKERAYPQPPNQNQGFANTTHDPGSETPDRRSVTPDRRSETPDRRSTEEYLRLKEDLKDTPPPPVPASVPQEAGCVVSPPSKKLKKVDPAEQLVSQWWTEAKGESHTPEKSELFYARYILNTYKDKAFGVVVRATELLRKRGLLQNTQGFYGLKTVMQQVSLAALDYDFDKQANPRGLPDLHDYSYPKADLAPPGVGSGSPPEPAYGLAPVSAGEPRQYVEPAGRAGVGAPVAPVALPGSGQPSDSAFNGDILSRPAEPESPPPYSWPTRPVAVFPGCQAPLVFPDQVAQLEGLLGRLGRLPELPAGLPVFKQAAIKGDRFAVQQAIQATLEGRRSVDELPALVASVGRLEAQAVGMGVGIQPVGRRAVG